VLVVNSLGGWLAAKGTTGHPVRVRALYLVNAARLPQYIPIEAILPDTTQGMRDKMDIILGEHAQAAPDFVVRALAKMNEDERLHALYQDLQQHPQHVGPAMALNQTPLAFVWGTPDRFFPVEPYLREYQALRPDANTVLLPGCGHAPQYSCPEQLVQVVLNPLQE